MSVNVNIITVNVCNVNFNISSNDKRNENLLKSFMDSEVELSKYIKHDSDQVNNKAIELLANYEILLNELEGNRDYENIFKLLESNLYILSTYKDTKLQASFYNDLLECLSSTFVKYWGEVYDNIIFDLKCHEFFRYLYDKKDSDSIFKMLITDQRWGLTYYYPYSNMDKYNYTELELNDFFIENKSFILSRLLDNDYNSNNPPLFGNPLNNNEHKITRIQCFRIFELKKQIENISKEYDFI